MIGSSVSIYTVYYIHSIQSFVTLGWTWKIFSNAKCLDNYENETIKKTLKMFKFSSQKKNHLKKSFWKIIFAVDSAPHGRRLDATLFGNASTFDPWPNTHLISFPLRVGNTFSRRIHHKKDRINDISWQKVARKLK